MRILFAEFCLRFRVCRRKRRDARYQLIFRNRLTIMCRIGRAARAGPWHLDHVLHVQRAVCYDSASGHMREIN